MSGAEFGTRGFIDAYDAQTGKRVWRTYTVPMPGEPGGDSWPGDTAKLEAARHGSPARTIRQTNTVFWGIGNPGPFNAAVRKGDNLYTDSILALDAKTARSWHFQFPPNDPFDYDSVAEMVLATINIEGKPTKVVMDANRNAILLRP